VLDDAVLKPGQAIIITGNIPELGNWNTKKAPILESVYNNVWSTIVVGVPLFSSK
jgi:hypothetical protein